MSRYYRRCLIQMALALLIGLTAIAAVQAQVGPQPFYVTPDVPTFGRAMIKLRMETPTLFNVGTVTAPSWLYQPAGRFQIQTATPSPDGGNPTRSGDENRVLASVTTPYATATWGFQYSSAVVVAIDTDPADPTAGAYQDPHLLSATLGPEALTSDLVNLWPLAPTPGARDIAGEFRVPIVRVPDTSTSEWINVRQVATVVGDMVRLEYIVTNQSLSGHSVGLRALIDTGFGGASNMDGEPVLLPDGRIIDTEHTIPDPTVPNDVMPTRWVSYDNPASPLLALRGVLNTTEVFDPGIANSAAGMPDSISWGLMRNVGVPQQYYTLTNPRQPLTGEDTAYTVFWAPKLLSPGESRRYVTYFGLGSSAGDYEPPYALMAYGPFSLVSQTGDDPATPDVTEQFYLTDETNRSPFPVSVYMDNFGTSPIFDASARVRLPLGIELAPGETVAKSAGIIQRNEIKSLTWNLLATASRPGHAEIKFTGPRGKVVTRSLNIPALPILNPLPNASLGLEMVSVPFEFSNNDAEWIFQSLGSLLPGGPAAVIRYDPQGNTYRWFPDPSITAITPGMGFWLLNRNREQVVLPPDATPVDPTRIFSVDLKAGWNQIGNPFGTSVRLDQVRVAGVFGGEWSMDEAVSRNMLLPTIYAYDPETNNYTWDLSPTGSFVDPYMGYWILAREDLSLLFPSPTLFTPAQQQVQPVAAPEPTGPNNWKVELRVNAPGLQSTSQSIAVKANAKRGLDRYDVPQPPSAVKEDATQLQSALYSGEAALGMPYLVDTRSANEREQQWNLVVRTNAVKTPVTVTWPSLNALPANMIATLVDEATGQRRYMRTTTSYTFQTSDQPTDRVLKVLVQPRPAQGLSVTAVNTAQTAGGVSLTYTLSTPAAVDVRVRNIAGKVVSEVALDRLSPAGQNTLLWNGRNGRGTIVPAGRYLCEITARSPETGQSISVVQPVQLAR